jgi:hydroxymethylpyrimidine/phosphomethylpyrimidine kinase
VETLEDAQAAARAIADLGPRAVVVKGGHINTDAQDLTSSERAKGAGRAVDVLYTGGTIQLLERERIATRTDHGTGCTFAAAIAAGLALGLSLTDAILQAKEVVTLAVRFGLPIGKGHGPVNPLATLYREADRAAVMANVSDAVRILEDNPESARLAPESQINIAMAIPAPRSVTDVCGVRGRVILVGDRLRAGGAPAFGASRHVARTLLVASDHDPRIRAAMNIRYSEAILRAAGALGLLVSWYDRREEPPEVKAQEGATTSWGATQAIARVGRVPDIIYHTGDWGKEPMMIILGESAVAVAQTALRLARSLSE